MRKPIDFKKNNDDGPGDGDNDPGNDDYRNKIFIPNDQPTRFDYINTFNKILDIMKNKNN